MRRTFKSAKLSLKSAKFLFELRQLLLARMLELLSIFSVFAPFPQSLPSSENKCCFNAHLGEFCLSFGQFRSVLGIDLSARIGTLDSPIVLIRPIAARILYRSRQYSVMLTAHRKRRR